MKKIILFLSIFFSIATLRAEQPPQITVVVDYFNRASGVNSKYKDMLRSAVLSAFTSSGRCKVIDAANERALALSADVASAEVLPTLDNIRRDAMVEAGGNYLITGSVVNVGSDKDKTSEGKVYYTGIVNISLNMVDLSTGNSVAAKEIRYSGIYAETGSTSDQAIAATIGNVSGAVRSLINEHFKVSTSIIQVEEVKKNRARTVYINVGSSSGIKSGQLFTVYQVKNVAGNVARTEVGKLVAQDVQGAEVTLCKVSGNTCGELILQASNDPERVVLEIVSGSQRTTFSLF
ncbi:MAG: hypothetical protein R3Y19_01040 [Rikenellaceae bacterium]